MIVPPLSGQVWLSTGVTDMRRGMNSLALQVPSRPPNSAICSKALTGGTCSTPGGRSAPDNRGLIFRVHDHGAM
jgi:transposase